MSLIALARSGLKSQTVRQLVGERTIDIFSEISRPQEEEGAGDGGLIPRWMRSMGRRIANFALAAVGRVGAWLLQNAWEIIVDAAITVTNFDWNQTDAAIESSINSNNVQIAAALGNLAGTGGVWLAGIGIAGAITMKFPVLGGRLAIALAQEGGEEIRGAIHGLLATSRNAVVSNLVLGGLLSLRRLRLFGLAPVTQQREPWSIAGAVESRVESIQSDTLRAFVENAIESAVDAIIELGYVVQYTIDDFYQSMKLAQQQQFGQTRTVLIQPDNRLEGEKIALTGNQTLLQQSIQTVLGTHRMVHNRDVGQIVGQPAEDWLKGRYQRRKLTVVFKSKEKPPWVATNGESIKESTMTVPDVEVGLTWREIKLAAKPFTWGKYRATANLDNGRQMACYGATAAEAEEKLRELKQLTSAEILTLSVTEEKDRHPGLRKTPTRMYPAYATLLIRRSTAEISGSNDLTGTNYRQERIRIELWTDSEPLNLPPLQ